VKPRAEGELRMNAYYYGFEPTGVPAIDAILSAVAWAGKAVHHTEGWSEEAYSGQAPEPLRGETPVEWIQNAANDAAKRYRSYEQWLATEQHKEAQATPPDGDEPAATARRQQR
jgi:hypothetical protein